MDDLSIYVEHLVNIGTLSIQASLPSPASRKTEIRVSADGGSIQLTHETSSAHLRLPVNVEHSATEQYLRISGNAAQDLSFRVPLSVSAQRQAQAGVAHGATEESNDEPWSASCLGAEVEISCRNCSSVIVPRSSIRVWKDLPSENWAEMMDFWHCHRPHVPHDHGEADGAPNRKGYSADSKLALHAEVGMVDPVDFVLHPDNCPGVKMGYSTVPETANSEVLCASCSSRLGQRHGSTDGYKLRKSHLALSHSHDEAPQSYGEEEWMACYLMSNVLTQGVRKFLVIPAERRPPDLLELWIFTPNLVVASTALPVDHPIRVAKVLWRLVPDDDAMDDGRLDRQALSQGHIEMAEDDVAALQQLLEASARIMPASARNFMGWNVALLHRFDGREHR